MRRFRLAVVAGVSTAIAICIGVGALMLSTPAAQAAPADVNGYLARTNELRAGLGLPPLVLDPELTSVAQSWAEQMAATGVLDHPPDVAAGIDDSRWLELGDNIGKGSTFEIAWQALVESPVHYKNLTYPTYTHIGIGVALAPDGTQYVNQRFMTAAPVEVAPEPTAPAPTVAQPQQPEAVAPVDPLATGVAGISLTRDVNVAVIPPIRYGRVADAALTESADGSGIPTWAIAAIAAFVALALLLVWQTVRWHRARGSA